MLFAVPAAMDAILRAIEDSPALRPEHLETIAMGGAPVLRPLLERLHSCFPDTSIRAIYGMTEILPVAVADGVASSGVIRGTKRRPSGPADAQRECSYRRWRTRAGGPGLARGYLAELPDPPLTELRTGDFARIDGDELVLLGRTRYVHPGSAERLPRALRTADRRIAGSRRRRVQRGARRHRR